MLSIYSHWALGLSLKRTGHKNCHILFLLHSSFLSFILCEYINCIFPINQRKENKSQKEAGKGPNLKKELLWELFIHFSSTNIFFLTSPWPPSLQSHKPEIRMSRCQEELSRPSGHQKFSTGHLLFFVTDSLGTNFLKNSWLFYGFQEISVNGLIGQKFQLFPLG